LTYHQRSDPNVLVTGHCNVTQDRIIQISDQTGAGLLEAFGAVREDFFIGLSTLVEDEQDVKTAMEAGMDAHIAKPIDVNILYETLTQVMGREA